MSVTPRSLSSLPSLPKPSTMEKTLISLLFISFISPTLSQSPYQEDQTPLLLFKSHLNDPTQSLATWLPSTPSTWTGIFLSDTRHVISLNLSDMGLSGAFHPAICKLQYLQTLVLFNNYFNGPVPTCLYHLKSLKYIDLSKNNFRGKLGEFYQDLGYLNLEANSFSGTVPCLFASNNSIYFLNLANNFFNGGIPTCLSSLRELKQLNLSSNRLSFEVSPLLVFSEKLIVLDFSFNTFSGPIPRKIAEPMEKSCLLFLDLSHNQFSGTIPLSITEFKSLEALFLSHNSLTGEIPERIGNLTYLQVIDLSHNSFSGSIPSSIVGCFQLLALILNNNNLSGEIKPELDAFDGLKILDISNNKIHGEIPLTLAACKSLEVVDFSYNNLSGPINDAMTKWSNLKYVSLAKNSFTGTLPSWLLSFLVIRTIDLSGNKFSGYIPDANFNISLNFNYTNTSIGSTPVKSFVLLRELQMRLSVAFYSFKGLSFDYDLISPIAMDLSENLLLGEIPSTLFGLIGLEYLNLSFNSLDGEIPMNLNRMRNLKVLDLSHNSLSGNIPDNLSSLGNLTLLNLSYNCLSGTVPDRKGFLKFPGAFAGNPNLCMETPGCETRSPGDIRGKTFEEEEEGPISVWIFCVTAFISFYIGVGTLFCSGRTRNYFLQPEF